VKSSNIYILQIIKRHETKKCGQVIIKALINKWSGQAKLEAYLYSSHINIKQYVTEVRGGGERRYRNIGEWESDEKGWKRNKRHERRKDWIFCKEEGLNDIW
jgi:hypothetical protein